MDLHKALYLMLSAVFNVDNNSMQILLKFLIEKDICQILFNLFLRFGESCDFYLAKYSALNLLEYYFTSIDFWLFKNNIINFLLNKNVYEKIIFEALKILVLVIDMWKIKDC